jgi:hypothetical protein
MQSSNNPFLFVVGCPRSGTTLLQRMLDHHPILAVSNDTHFIPRVLEDEANPLVTHELIEKVVNYKRFYRLGLDLQFAREIGENSHDFREFVCGLYDAFAKLHEKELAGEKTPDYVKHLLLLHNLFPCAKFIHIFRDGRDVALSMLEWADASVKKGPAKFQLWEKNPLAVCALFWRWQVAQGLKDSTKLQKKLYCEIRYEELVSDPIKNLQRISSFLNLPYRDEMANYHLGKTKYAKNLSAKSAWLPPTPGLRNWRMQMAVSDMELFEALAGDLLETLEYPRMFSRIFPKIADEAANYRHQFETETQKRPLSAALVQAQFTTPLQMEE